MRVDEMPAGGKLNCLIAERLLNWEDAGWDPLYCRFVGHPTKERYRWYEQVPDYSTDIARAWEVVEKMKNYLFVCGRTDDGIWEAYFFPVNSGIGKLSEAHGDTAPSAICRAALKAMGVTEC